MSLEKEIEKVLNRACAENGSGTPNLILAEYLLECLAAFDKATRYRELWYGRDNGKAPVEPAPAKDAGVGPEPEESDV